MSDYIIIRNAAKVFNVNYVIRRFFKRNIKFSARFLLISLAGFLSALSNALLTSCYVKVQTILPVVNVKHILNNEITHCEPVIASLPACALHSSNHSL